jgi:hypothetical protein
VWADPQTFSEAVRADAVVKRAALGVPQKQLWEDLGVYSPQQIEEWTANPVAPPVPPPGIPGA